MTITVRTGGAGRQVVVVQGGAARRVVLDKRTTAAIADHRPTVVVRPGATPVTVDGHATVVHAGGGMGVQGIPGVAGGAYTHTQKLPSTSWTIAHNLGFHPSIELRSAGGAEVDAEVTHLSLDVAVATFSQPLAGTARCN